MFFHQLFESEVSRPTTQQSQRPATQQSSASQGMASRGGASRPTTQQSQRPGTSQSMTSSMAAATNVAVGKPGENMERLLSWLR